MGLVVFPFYFFPQGKRCQAELVCWPAYVYDTCEKVGVDFIFASE